MEEGLILTNEQIKYIIDSIPDLSFERIRNEHFLDFYDAYSEKEIHLKFENVYQIKLPELMEKLSQGIFNKGVSRGEWNKAIEIRKALYLNE